MVWKNLILAKRLNKKQIISDVENWRVF